MSREDACRKVEGGNGRVPCIKDVLVVDDESHLNFQPTLSVPATSVRCKFWSEEEAAATAVAEKNKKSTARKGLEGGWFISSTGIIG